jgi:integrase
MGDDFLLDVLDAHDLTELTRHRLFHGRAGLVHATCHELRHTCFTKLREAGMALEAIQAQAGHRSIETPRLYLQLSNDWLADEYQRAAELIDVSMIQAVAR